jgi:two-component system, cell cycle response regulator DivK
MTFYPNGFPVAPSAQTLVKILLVENDYLLAAGTVRLLAQQSGYSVNATDRPEQVLEQCESGQVDLVLMDATLRRMDWKGQRVSSADLSQYLKMNPKTAHIPIVLLSAYGLPEPRSQWLLTYQVDAVMSDPMMECGKLVGILEGLQVREPTFLG